MGKEILETLANFKNLNFGFILNKIYPKLREQFHTLTDKQVHGNNNKSKKN